jgi:hypothetical protein
MIWHSIRDFLPGRNVRQILLYFASSQNLVLINLDEDPTNTSNIVREYIFKRKYHVEDKPDNYIDWPTHWMEVKFPVI